MCISEMSFLPVVIKDMRTTHFHIYWSARDGEKSGRGSLSQRFLIHMSII